MITSLGLGLSVWCSFSCLSSSASLLSPGSSQGHSYSNCFVLVSAFCICILEIYSLCFGFCILICIEIAWLFARSFSFSLFHTCICICILEIYSLCFGFCILIWIQIAWLFARSFSFPSFCKKNQPRSHHLHHLQNHYH